MRFNVGSVGLSKNDLSANDALMRGELRLRSVDDCVLFEDEVGAAGCRVEVEFDVAFNAVPA